jgi:hypothetical protein
MVPGLATWLSMLLAGAGASLDAVPPADPAPAPMQRWERLGDADFLVVPTPAMVPDGPVVTYRVLVERRYAASADDFAAHVDEVLADDMGWAAAGYAFAPVDGDADMTIVLAAPKTTDRLCAPLRTGGAFSCGRGGRAVINANRFLRGAATYRKQLPAYRTYVINHEVGHLLGFEHRRCPHRGAEAPVMLQQTKSLAGCRRNATPRADELAVLAARPPRYLRERVATGSPPPIAAAVADAATLRSREGRTPLRSAP